MTMTSIEIGGYAMCDEADYSYAVQSERFPHARKEHHCYACSEPIRIGDKYAYSVAIGEEGFDSYKHCLRCLAILNAISLAHAKMGSSVAIRWDLNCGENWLDAIGELPDEIARLAFLTRDEIQQLEVMG